MIPECSIWSAKSDRYTEMEKIEAGAGLKEKLKFCIEEVKFEMLIGSPVRK